MSSQTIYLAATDAMARRLARATFPEYNGAKFKLVVTPHMPSLSLYWDGGSRDYAAAIDLTTMQSVQLPGINPLDPAAHAAVRQLTDAEIPPSVVVVRHSIFCGKDSGITFYVRPENAAPLLPVAAEITDRERSILGAFKGYTSTYRKEWLLRAKVQPSEIDALVARKLLKRNAAGACQITVEGKNAAGKSY